MRIYTLADITGASAPAAVLDATAGEAKWIQFTCTGSGSARVGDSNASATRGTPVPAGSGLLFPVNAEPFERYSLNQIYAYVPTGASLSITYGV